MSSLPTVFCLALIGDTRETPVFLLILGLAGLVIWVWAMIDCSKHAGATEADRHRQSIWLIVIALANVAGAAAYYFFGRHMLAKTAETPTGPTDAPLRAAAAAAGPGAAPAGGNPAKGSGRCPQCGAALGTDAPEGLCPRCLLQMNLDAPTQFTGAGASGVAATMSTPPPPPPPSVEDIAKHFPQLEIIECLGRGGMGVVYKARQPRLNRIVALKVLAPGRQQDPQFAERFLREAQALAKLNHPNIVTVYDFGESDGLFYLLMEFVDGVTLRGLLHGGKTSPEQALAIVPRICEALQYAHEVGVVHRDIKPENILLDKLGRVKIADFGIARILGVEGQPSHTRDRYVIGTPYYMAPEQVEKPLSVDHRADIYSLGVVFYEMLTGELPLGRFALPSQKVQVDVRLDDVVLRALEKEPQLRYQHASQVKSDVETISGGGTGGLAAAVANVPPPPVVPPPATTAGTGGIFPGGESVFSRKAVVGAVWAAVLILGFIPLWGVRVESSQNYGPPTWEKLLVMIIFALGVTAPFGTTILGWLAVGDIRRSAGRIHGMGLAVFDGLLFPLLVLDGLMGFMCYLGANLILEHFAQWEPNREGYLYAHRLDFLLGAIAISLVVDGLIARVVWRSLHPPVVAPATPQRSRDAGMVLVLVVALLVLGVMGMNFQRKVQYATPADASPVALQQEAEQDLRDNLTGELQNYSVRFDQSMLSWGPDLQSVTFTFSNLREMDGVNGKNVWQPIDGTLKAIYQGNNAWKVRGDGQLGHVQFFVSAPGLATPAVGDDGAGSTPGGVATFGPTVELELHAAANNLGNTGAKNCWLSLSTGQMLSESDYPAPLMSQMDIVAWLKQHGMDLACVAYPNNQPTVSGQLMPGPADAQCRFIRVPDEEFARILPSELPRYAELIQMGAKDEAGYDGFEQLPGSYYFKTLSGLTGILEVESAIDDHQGVRIRYKLVQPEGAQSVAAAVRGPDLGEAIAMVPKLQKDIEQLVAAFDQGSAANATAAFNTTQTDFATWQTLLGGTAAAALAEEVNFYLTDLGRALQAGRTGDAQMRAHHLSDCTRADGAGIDLFVKAGEQVNQRNENRMQDAAARWWPVWMRILGALEQAEGGNRPLALAWLKEALPRAQQWHAELQGTPLEGLAGLVLAQVGDLQAALEENVPTKGITTQPFGFRADSIYSALQALEVNARVSRPELGLAMANSQTTLLTIGSANAAGDQVWQQWAKFFTGTSGEKIADAIVAHMAKISAASRESDKNEVQAMTTALIDRRAGVVGSQAPSEQMGQSMRAALAGPGAENLALAAARSYLLAFDLTAAGDLERRSQRGQPGGGGGFSGGSASLPSPPVSPAAAAYVQAVAEWAAQLRGTPAEAEAKVAWDYSAGVMAPEAKWIAPPWDTPNQRGGVRASQPYVDRFLSWAQVMHDRVEIIGNNLLAEAKAAVPTATNASPANLNVLKAQLTQAQAELARVKPMHDAGLATELELETAEAQVAIVQAELTGDPQQVAKVKLSWIQTKINLLQQLNAAGLATAIDLQKARDEGEVVKAELADAQVKLDAGTKTAIDQWDKTTAPMSGPSAVVAAPTNPANAEILAESEIAAVKQMSNESARMTAYFNMVHRPNLPPAALAALANAAFDNLSNPSSKMSLLQEIILQPGFGDAAKQVILARLNLLPNGSSRAMILSDLNDQATRAAKAAPVVTPASRPAAANNPFASRLAAALTINTISTRDGALATVAVDAAKGGNADVADQAVGSIYTIAVRDQAAADAARALARMGLRDRALKLAQSIYTIETRDAALADIAQGTH